MNLLDFDWQKELAGAVLEIVECGNDALEAGIEKRGMQQIFLHRDGLRQMHLRPRFPIAAPTAEDALKQGAIIQADLPANGVAFLLRERLRTALADRIQGHRRRHGLGRMGRKTMAACAVHSSSTPMARL